MARPAPRVPLWLAVLVLLIGSFSLAYYVVEGFGSTSPGTMVQLATSHVPTQEDVYFFNKVYPGLVRRDLRDMTGADPGPLRPWHFPLQGLV